MGAIASGRIEVWEGGSLWAFDVPPGGPIRATDVHAHHALQVTFSTGGRFRLDAGDGWVDGPAVIVAADAEHAFTAEGMVAMLFVEPESPQGRALAAGLTGPLNPVPQARLGDLPARIAGAFRAPAAELRALGQALMARLAGEASSAAADPRVARIAAWAAEELERPVGIAEAAALVGLSPGRASHLFVEQTGLPFRTYVLWLRLMRAVEVYAAGQSLTSAAHEAGFSDSAHLSRTFRRMFGVTAQALELT